MTNENTDSVQTSASLTSEERADLDRVLFPDTDTRHVELLGKKRELKPLPIKHAKKLKAIIAPAYEKFQKGVEEASKEGAKDYEAENEVLEILQDAVKYLADFYNWDDVRKEIAEENVTLTDLQAVAAVQVNVNGENDFLLSGLRAVVRLMQTQALAIHRFRNMLTGQH